MNVLLNVKYRRHYSKLLHSEISVPYRFTYISLEIKTDYPAMLEGHWRTLKSILDFEDKHYGIWKEQSCFISSFCKGSVIQNMILWSDTISASGLLPYSESRVLVMV